MQQDRKAARGGPVDVGRTRSRSFTARSVLLSLLLGNDPPRSPVHRLVRTAELFGIADGTTRTALSRMVTAGELRTADGWYELAAPDLLRRLERQRASRAGVTFDWVPGRWTQAVIVGDGRRGAAERSGTRRWLLQLRLSELREGVWLRPDNLGNRRAQADQPAVIRWFDVTPTDDQRLLATRLWDLEGWAARAETLIDDMERLLGRLTDLDRSALADGFVTSAAVLRHFQADPLLPAELLPAGWPGQHLRARYDDYDAAYRRLLADWFRTSF